MMRLKPPKSRKAPVTWSTVKGGIPGNLNIGCEGGTCILQESVVPVSSLKVFVLILKCKYKFRGIEGISFVEEFLILFIWCLLMNLITQVEITLGKCFDVIRAEGTWMDSLVLTGPTQSDFHFGMTK